MEHPSTQPFAGILRELRHHPMTALEIQTATALSAPTTLRTLKKLRELKLIQIFGKRESTGGRKAKTYRLKADAKFVVGIHLELPALHLLLCDLVGNVIESEFVSEHFDASPEQALSKISLFVRKMQQSKGIDQIAAVGIAAPGYLDDMGTIISIGRDPSWENVPIAPRLRAELGLPVLIENDVDCMAQSEVELALNEAVTDFIYLGFTEGVKAALILDGEFYRGPFGNAGTIGHTTVDPRGQVCRCGNQGCLETIASVRAICASFDEQLAQHPLADPRLLEINRLSDRLSKFNAILDAAEAHDPLCAAIMTRALDALALAMANLVEIFQVKVIIVGGALSTLPVGLRSHLDAQVRKRIIPLLRNNLTIRYALYTRPDSAAFGAASRATQSYLSQRVERLQV